MCIWPYVFSCDTSDLFMFNVISFSVSLQPIDWFHLTLHCFLIAFLFTHLNARKNVLFWTNLNWKNTETEFCYFFYRKVFSSQKNFFSHSIKTKEFHRNKYWNWDYFLFIVSPISIEFFLLKWSNYAETRVSLRLK